VKRFVPRGARRQPASGRAVERDQTMTDEAMADFTIEELREFLQGDSLDVPVDPAFKERLRQRLWELVQEQVRQRRGDA
jgi:hypothetical protein